MITLDFYEGAAARLVSRRETFSYIDDVRRLQAKLDGLRYGPQTHGKRHLARNLERQIAIVRQFAAIG